jgi:hypothetical protein
MKLLTQDTDYNSTINLAQKLKLVENFNSQVNFHCYWNGNLNLKHLYSILSFNYFHPNHKIILWLEHSEPNKYFNIIQNYVDIKYFDINKEILGTFLQDINLNYRTDSITHYSDCVRTILLYKYGGIWFDLDCLSLKNFDTIFSNFRDSICVYTWETQNYPNNAIYISLQPESNRMKSNIEYILAKNKGWGFQEANLTFDLDLDFLVLPCSWFDGQWIPNPYNIDNIFQSTEITYDFTNFYYGAFCYHWHNKWHYKIESNSIIRQLIKNMGYEYESKIN